MFIYSCSSYSQTGFYPLYRSYYKVGDLLRLNGYSFCPEALESDRLQRSIEFTYLETLVKHLKIHCLMEKKKHIKVK